jgi:hypothetical protein
MSDRHPIAVELVERVTAQLEFAQLNALGHPVCARGVECAVTVGFQRFFRPESTLGAGLTLSAGLTPERDVNLWAKPRHPDPAAPDHRLDTPRSRDEPDQFGHGRLPG